MSGGFFSFGNNTVAEQLPLFVDVEINTASNFPTTPNNKVIYQVNNNLTIPTGKAGAGSSFKSGDLIVWDSDRGDGVGEYVVLDNKKLYRLIPDNYAITSNLVGGVVPNGYNGYRDYDGSYTANVTLPVTGKYVGEVFHVNNTATFTLNVQTTNTNMVIPLVLGGTTQNRNVIFEWDGAKWVLLSEKYSDLFRVFFGSVTSPTSTVPTSTPKKGDMYLQTTTGNDSGVVRSEWIYTGTLWKKISPVESSFFGSDNPNTTSPTTSPLTGDKYIQTSDGTSTGVVKTLWEYINGAWIQLAGFPTNPIIPSSTIRTYYPSYTAYNNKWLTALTAANISSMGFTAVGGASIIDSGTSIGLPAYRALRVTATRPTITTTANTLYTIPTQYIRQEIAIKPTTENTYFLQVLTGGAAREVSVEVWLCNPVSNLPVKRLYANTAPKYMDTATSTNNASVQRAPDNGSSYEDNHRYWLAYNLPNSIINTYKTSTNTIKLAVRPSGDNGEANNFSITGYAMCESNYSFLHLPMMVFENTANVSTFRTTGSGGNYPLWQSDYAGYSQSYVPLNQNRIFDIPILDTSKDIYLTFLGLIKNATDGEPVGLTKSTIDIVHSSGDVNLGRPRLDIFAPSTTIIEFSWQPVGYIIPASMLAAKATDNHVNSAIKYLKIRVNVPNISDNANIGAVITEHI